MAILNKILEKEIDLFFEKVLNDKNFLHIEKNFFNK